MNEGLSTGIEIKNISKSFGHTNALTNVSIHLAPERIYGLLGQNGAGKSTLLNLITNRIFADSGDIYVDGASNVENDRALSRIYMMSENTLYPEDMKLKDTFKWSAHFYPDFDMERALKLAEIFKLKLNKKVKSLSTGYTSIFKLIIALCVNTPYLLLDEPVLGLDANHRDIFYKYMLEKYIEHPCTIIISTHLIEEVAGALSRMWSSLRKAGLLKIQVRMSFYPEALRFQERPRRWTPILKRLDPFGRLAKRCLEPTALAV